MITHPTRRGLLAAALFLALGARAAEPNFPSQPIRLVVPFAPGGGNDLLARIIAPRLGELLGQPVLVDNRPGAGGNLGTDLVAKAAPDGYTVLMASNQITIDPGLGIRTPYQVTRDFAPVGLIASVPIILVANPKQPYKSPAEFLAFARANAGKLSYSSPGTGTPQHLAGEVFGRMTHTSLLHVPYRGTGPALADLVGGQVQVAFGTLASVLPFIESGKLTPIGVAGPRKSRLLPSVPALGEMQELKDFDTELWYSLLAPAKTPPAVVAKLNAALDQAVRMPKVAEQMAKQGFEAATSTPEQLRTRIEADTARWTRVAREYNIKVEQ